MLGGNDAELDRLVAALEAEDEERAAAAERRDRDVAMQLYEADLVDAGHRLTMATSTMLADVQQRLEEGALMAVVVFPTDSFRNLPRNFPRNFFWFQNRPKQYRKKIREKFRGKFRGGCAGVVSRPGRRKFRSGFAPRQTKNSAVISPSSRAEKSATETEKNEKEMGWNFSGGEL